MPNVVQSKCISGSQTLAQECVLHFQKQLASPYRHPKIDQSTEVRNNSNLTADCSHKKLIMTIEKEKLPEKVTALFFTITRLKKPKHK